MDRKIRVCLVIEGSYPYITGGVSSWVHQLILSIPEIEFILYTISPKKEQVVQYTVPINVVEHHDIVLSQVVNSPKKVFFKKKLFSEIRKMHDLLKVKSNPDFKKLLQLLPEKYFLYSDAMNYDMGWNMVVTNNQHNNPAYPFADYFWSWKSSHDMLFTILGAKPPEADIYHAISTGYAGLAAVVAKIKTGNPLILTEHGLYHKEREIEIKRAAFVKGYQRDMWINIYNSLSRLTYQYSDVIISLFEYNRRLQIELGAIEKKCKVIPNGINIEFFSTIKKEKRAGFHIGLVGRVVPIKDVKCFILASRILAELISDVQFYCIGPTDEDPVYFAECQAFVESFKIGNRFSFTGTQDVRAYYSFLDVIMLTSIREAQPLVILEAYAAGIPVVATRVGNVPELLDYDDRFIASSKDSEKLASGVKYIYEHPDEMNEIKKKNYEKVKKFYDRTELHNTYRDLYKQTKGI